MKEEIIIRYKDDREEESSIIEKFSKECERLGTYCGKWKMKNQVIYWDGSFANDHFFIRLGGLQKALLGIAFFQQGYDVPGLSLCLEVGRTWEDVLNRMAEIESIEV